MVIKNAAIIRREERGWDDAVIHTQQRASVASADKEFSAAFGLFAYAAATLNMAPLKPLITNLGYCDGIWNGCQ